MKKSISILLLVIIFGMLSCENELDGLYKGEQGVYFMAPDSITYTFLGNPRQQDTAFFSVRLLGFSQPHAQKLKIRVVPEKTTAVVGVHYQQFPDEYEFPPNTFDYQLPIVLIKHPDLDEGSFTLAIELIKSDDLMIPYANRSKAQVVFSNIAMQPSIWNGTLAPWFGEYSRIKHIVCMEIMGRPFPQTVLEFNLERNLWRNWGWICSNYFRDNIVMNTDVDPPQRILPWF